MTTNKVADEKVTSELVKKVDKKDFPSLTLDKTNNSNLEAEKGNKNLENDSKLKS